MPLWASAIDLSFAPAYIDVAEASKAIANQSLIGEYVSSNGQSALQANLLPKGDFLVSTYSGGLPGAGWGNSAGKSQICSPKELEQLLAGYNMHTRRSPTLGAPPPEKAILVFPDDFTNIENGIMMAGGQTKKSLGSFHMHVEFMVPLKPGRNPSSQDRGNSGVYIFNNYEIQILDTFALVADTAQNPVQLESNPDRWCGALYKTKMPDVNMSLPPLQWQTYDIDFHAPVFEGETKTRNARITVRHNGVLIHDDVELKTGTGNGAKKPQLAKGPVYFQNHANPVLFRNIWATELK